MGVYFSNTIAKPLGAKIAGVVGVAERISTGDLTTSIELTGADDEIGKLQKAFQVMSKNLNTLIQQVQRSGILITTSATQIAASGKQLEAKTLLSNNSRFLFSPYLSEAALICFCSGTKF